MNKTLLIIIPFIVSINFASLQAGEFIAPALADATIAAFPGAGYRGAIRLAISMPVVLSIGGLGIWIESLIAPARIRAGATSQSPIPIVSLIAGCFFGYVLADVCCAG